MNNTMSFTPAFDELKSPFPDQTTMTQYLPRSTARMMGIDPPENHHDNECHDHIPPAIPPTNPSPTNSPQSMNHKKTTQLPQEDEPNQCVCLCI